MSDGIDILVHPGESPFDAMRHTDYDGREYWLGRDLMPHLGYATWENFAETVRRARAACRNAGQIEARNFRDVTKNPTGQVGRPRMDVELSRFGAYLVSMNGDPTKAQVAAAQSYFVTATRWAETAQRSSLVVPKTLPEALRAYAAEVEAREAAEEQALRAAKERDDAEADAEQARKALEQTDRQLGAALGEVGALLPKAEAYETFLNQAGAYPLAVAAQMLGTGRQRLIDQLGAWRVLIIRPGHSDHLRPYTEHLHEGRFVVKSADVPIVHRDGTPEVITRGTTLVTPKGLDYIRARRIREERQRTLKEARVTPVPSVA